MDNSGQGVLRVPGFNSMPVEKEIETPFTQDATERAGYPFFHGASEWHAERLTVREVAMLRLMDVLTDKQDFTRKLFDEEITARWKAEAMATPGGMISERAWDWVLSELRHRVPDFQAARRILTYDNDSRIAKSDSLVELALQNELKRNVLPLLNVPDETKDWHPGSDGKVLNLVHPSLFPLVYGRSNVLQQGGQVSMDNVFELCGKGDVAPTHSVPDVQLSSPRLARPLASALKPTYHSRRFQWLPAEVEFSGNEGTTDVRITSYINNLHPNQHRELYGSIEKLIGLAVPLWNDVLVRSYDTRRRRIVAFEPVYAPANPQPRGSPRNRPRTFLSPQDDGYAEYLEWVKQYLALPEPEAIDSDDDEGEEGGRRGVIAYTGPPEQHPRFLALQDELARITSGDPMYRQWSGWFQSPHSNAVHDKWLRIRKAEHPDPGESRTFEAWEKYRCSSVYQDRTPIRLQDRFRAKGLQVIVKIASVELTPDRPSYEGGSWHLEGMLNEHIVATAIYYYDVENVTDATLYFRQKAQLDESSLKYEQDQHEDLCTIYGTESMRNEPAVQELGGVKTPGGRMLAFPNVLQHRVSPFRLVDPERPGHRRFVVLWLVDPQYRICSTRNVPPQRHDWWAEEASRNFRVDLPLDISKLIADKVEDYPMGLVEAQNLRLDLMAERTTMTEAVQHDFETYNLCEH